jgi:hypothetical protein
MMAILRIVWVTGKLFFLLVRPKRPFDWGRQEGESPHNAATSILTVANLRKAVLAGSA